MCVCVCACVCVRARACVCVCVQQCTRIHNHSGKRTSKGDEANGGGVGVVGDASRLGWRAAAAWPRTLE